MQAALCVRTAYEKYAIVFLAPWVDAAVPTFGRTTRGTNGEDFARPSQINFDASADKYIYAEKGINRKKSTKVGSFKPNALGLFDMSGNAWEWCTDVLSNYPATRRINPYVPGDEPRILRGGSMGGDARSARVFSRFCFGRADHCGNSGFRVARSQQSRKTGTHKSE